MSRVAKNPGFDVARATSVLRQSPARRAPRCPHFGVCGGCATQHADARTQVAAKQRWLEDCLARIGKVSAECLLPPLYGEEWGYRRRARLSVRYVPSRGALVGFRERRSTYVADMRSCDVLPPHVSALIPRLRELVDAWKNGDTTVIARLESVELKKDSPALYKSLIVDRNKAWAQILAKRLRAPASGTSIVAVGAGHLAGPDSLQKQLQSLGFTVTVE